MTGDIFQFLADSVTGTNNSGNLTTYYIVRRKAQGDTLTPNDKNNFLAPASNLYLNFDMYGNNINGFANSSTHYIAFRIQVVGAYGGGFLYGWIKLVINNYKLMVYQIGLDYNTNEPIAMGQTQ
jgi:hypothetical protein